MLRSITGLVAGLGLVAVLVAAPVGFSGDRSLIGANDAAAQPGNGKGGGQGRGHGSLGGEAGAQGLAGANSNGGYPNGQAIGYARNDVGSGAGPSPPGQAKAFGYDGVSGTLGVKGSFNAIHSAAINKDLPPQSRVARVKAYLDAAQALSDLENAPGNANDLEAAIEAAAMAAANASSQPVTADMLDRVDAFSNARGLTTPGIDVSPETQGEVADRAQGLQTGP